MIKIVVHHKTGTISKGNTNDFSPSRPSFHLRDLDDAANVSEISLENLKAVFVVKDFNGNPQHIYSRDFSECTGFGKHIIVTFNDGEQFHGVSDAIHRNRTGFFVTPIDSEANTIRAFVINAFIKDVEFV